MSHAWIGFGDTKDNDCARLPERLITAKHINLIFMLAEKCNMKNKTIAEVWLRGQLPGLLPALQPVAHALLQVREELNELMENFPAELLWKQPAGLASAGFHLQHMKGVLDRLFTYAKAGILSARQLDYLSAEGRDLGQTVEFLVKEFNEQVDRAIEQLFRMAENELYVARGVGRQQIPSTVIGLVAHAAEHSMRHLGQLLVTVRILSADFKQVQPQF
jgi:uncharacterized damage-inducible protein DinB